MAVKDIPITVYFIGMSVGIRNDGDVNILCYVNIVMDRLIVCIYFISPKKQTNNLKKQTNK